MPKLKDIVKFLTMNRASLVGYSMFAGGLAGIVTGIVKNDGSIIKNSFRIASYGSYFLAATGLGRATYKTYKKTKEHIQEHKKLDERFVEKHWDWYCTRQGVYIAAKELGYLDDYKKAMEGKRIIIPNF